MEKKEEKKRNGGGGRGEAPVRVGLRGNKEEKKRNRGERGGLCTKGRKKRDEGRGGGWWVRVKEMKGGYVLKFNWVWGICGERKKTLG